MSNKRLNAKLFVISSLLMFFLLAQQLLAQNLTLDSDDKKYSYALGSKIAEQIVNQLSNQQGIELDALLQGITTTISGSAPLLSAQEVNEVLQQKQAAILAEATVIAEKNATEGKIFLKENQSKEGVITTDSGLQYKVLVAGDSSADSATLADAVVVHYRGSLINGTVFDSSYARGEAVTFPLGSIVPGWQEVLQLMKPGDKWAVVLPSELAYGERGSGASIGANATLLFDIELLEVKKSGN